MKTLDFPLLQGRLQSIDALCGIAALGVVLYHDVLQTQNGVLNNPPIIDVAAATGLCSQSHFSTTFKQMTGMTPAEYRSVFRSP
jgi:AraC-like DNA-binding protein